MAPATYHELQTLRAQIETWRDNLLSLETVANDHFVATGSVDADAVCDRDCAAGLLAHLIERYHTRITELKAGHV